MTVRFLFLKDYSGQLWLEATITFPSGKRETQLIELDGEAVEFHISKEGE